MFDNDGKYNSNNYLFYYVIVVSDLLSFQQIIAKIKEKKTEANNVLDKIEISKATSSPDFNLVLNAKKILIGPDNNVISIVEELPPVQSINFRDGSVRTPLTKKRPLNKKLDCLNVSNKEPFDILKESPIQNPLFKRNIHSASKTYMTQRKANENTTSKNTKMIPFEDDTNRINVIKWLDNSQNKFEYKPNTPEKILSGESESQSVFDMPSASQRHNLQSSPTHVPLISHINKQKEEQNKIREKNEIIARINRSNSKQNYNDKGRRTRSLEACGKTTKMYPQIKRHSITVPEDSKENFVIEQFNSEEEAFLSGMLKHPVKRADFIDLVEKECLNEIDMELLEKNEDKPQRKRKGKAANKSDTTGWTRIKEFKKALKRTERRPGKLTLTGVSHTSVASKNSSKSDGLNKKKKEKTKKKIELKITEPMIILENIDQTAQIGKTTKGRGKKKLKTADSVIAIDNNINAHSNSPKDHSNTACVYDLNILETYISKNIDKAESKGLPSSDSLQIIDNLQVEDSNKNQRRTRASSRAMNENKKNEELNEKPSTSSNNKDVYLTNRAITNINELRKSTPKSRKKLFNDEPEVENKLVPSLGLEEIESSLKHPEAIKSNHIEITKINSNDCKALNSHQTHSNDSEDEFFIKPTQITVENEKTEKPNLIFEDDEDEIFKIPTQVINPSKNNKLPGTLLKQKVQTLNSIASIIKNAFEDDNQNRSNFIAVLKDINQLIFNGQQKSLVDAQVQTSNLKELSSFFSQNATTQTASPKQKHKNVGVQTDICPSPGGFHISSTEMFKTQPLVSIHIQTDDLTCPKCNCLIKNSTEPIVLNNTRGSTEKYILSASFDNINFETQDILKGRQIQNNSSLLKNLKMTQNNHFKSFNGNNKENSLKQLDSAIPEKSNLTETKNLPVNNTNNLQKNKSYKRIRKLSSDSDPEDTATKNIKKNKFVDNDISIHFASELQEEISQSNHKAVDAKELILFESSEGINYQVSYRL